MMNYLKINYQDYEHECGVCVLNSLYNFFYSENISKTIFLEELDFSNNGMTIKEFEINAKKIGIDCKSYKVPFNEIKKFDVNDLFVMCKLEKFGHYHYIICKKMKNKIMVYDSIDGKKDYTYEEFSKIYSEIIITIKKNISSKIFNFSLENKLIFFSDWKFTIFHILIEFLLFTIALIISSFLKFYLNVVITNNNIYLLVIVCLFFLFLYFADYLLKLFFKFYKTKKIETLIKKNFLIIQKLLVDKPKIFFDKTEKKFYMSILIFWF